MVPPAPTKTALRVLRQLALGGATVVGAIGGVCGVVTTSYDVHRRIRLAEQVLDTKKQIRALSSGNGPSHLARMRSAAENGEDFGLDVGRRQNSRRTRHFSGVTEDRPLQPHLKSRPRTIDRTQHDEESRAYRTVQTVPGTTAASRIKEATIRATKAPSYKVFGRSNCNSKIAIDSPRAPEIDAAEKVLTAAAERIMAATKRQHKLQDHNVYGRPTQPKPAPISTLPECVDQWLMHTDRGRHATTIQPRPLKSDMKVTRDLNEPQSIAGLSQMSSTMAGPNSKKPSITRSIFFEPNFQRHSRRTFSTIFPKAFGPPDETTRSGSGETGQEKTTEMSDAAKQKFKNSPELQEHQNTLGTPFEPWAFAAADQISHFGPITLAAKPIASPLKQPAPEDKADAALQEPLEAKTSRLSSSQDRAIDRETAADLSVITRSTFLPENVDSQISTPSVEVDLQAVKEPSTFAKVSQSDQSVQDITAPTSVILQEQPESSLSGEVDGSPYGLLDFRASGIPIDDITRLEEHPSFQIFYHARSGESSSKTGSGPLANMVKAIQTTIADGNPQEAEKLWIKAMEKYAGPGDTTDFNMVQFLLEEFSGLRQVSLCFRPVRLLTRFLLERDGCCPFAARLLFTSTSIRLSRSLGIDGWGKIIPSAQIHRRIMKNALRYLADVWSYETDGFEIISEFQKVVGAAQRRGVELSEGLFVSVIRILCQHGEVDKAQAIFDDMTYQHGIKPTFYSRAVMLRAYAWAGEWTRVEKGLERLHNDGWSRRRPHGFALLFNSIFRHYAAKQSIEQTHDFLIHAVSYWGLIPTSPVTSSAIQAYLTHRRFDLVRQWIETVRVMFPQVETETSAFSWHLAETWERINASCQDIENTFEAMAFPQGKQAHNKDFNPLAREAVARDVAARLHTAEGVRPANESERELDLGDSPDLDGYLERALAMTPSAGTGMRAGELRELRSQAASAVRLNRLLSDPEVSQMPARASSGAGQPVRSAQPPSKLSRLQKEFPPELMEEFLPTLVTISKHLSTYYESRRSRGLPVEHAITKHVCDKLAQKVRSHDALVLLSNTFHSAYVQPPHGVMFDLSIMELWLRLAYELKSAPHYRQVLWAVVGKPGEGLKLTNKFRLLARIAGTKMHTHRFSLSRHQDYREMVWLNRQLKERMMEQSPEKCAW